MENSKCINVSNDFCSERFEVLCGELESGTHCNIYVDCIGHSRANWVEALYAERLKERYGDRLCVSGEFWDKAYYLK